MKTYSDIIISWDCASNGDEAVLCVTGVTSHGLAIIGTEYLKTAERAGAVSLQKLIDRYDREHRREEAQ